MTRAAVKTLSRLALALSSAACGDTVSFLSPEAERLTRGQALEACDAAGSCEAGDTRSSASTFRVLAAALAADDTTDVTFGWAASTDPEVSASRIERSATPSGPWSELGELPPSATLFTDAGLSGSVAYYRLVELAAGVEVAISEPLRVLSVAALEYHLEGEMVPGIDFATSLFGVVRHPSDLDSGPFPLVVFLHGNHGNCRDPETLEDVCVTQTSEICEQPGFVTAPNAQGYRYLQETLAAQGFLTVSLGANALNCRNDLSGFVPQRTQLILEHLRRWSVWSGAGAPPFGTLFSGAVDMTRVSLFGHSRGAEATSASPAALRATPIDGVSLASVFATAPTDFVSPNPSGVRFAGLIPSCDADVSDLVGVRHFDRTQLAPSNANPRAQVFFIGANHNFFNSEWLRDDNQEPDVDPVCSPEQLVGGPAQRAAFEPVFSDWIQSAANDAPLPPYMRADDDTPEAIDDWAETELDLRWSYGASARFVLDDFQTRSDPDFNTVGGQNTYTDFAAVTWFDSCSQSCRFPHRKQDVRTTWNGPANAQIEILDLDATAFDVLSMRFASSVQAIPVDPGTVEHDFSIAVRDTTGALAEVSLASVGRLAHGYPAVAPVRDVLSTVRVSFTDLLAINPELDRAHLAAIELVMPGNGSSTGAVWLSDLELASD